MRVSVFIAQSLDGFVAGKDGSLEFLESVQAPNEDYGYAAFIHDVDVLVMGRATYDVAAGFPEWPHASRRVVVLTHRPIEKPPAGVEAFAGEPKALVDKLAAEGVKHAYVDGAATIRAFLAAGLVDDITLSIIPVLLGDGVRLFGGAAPGLTLTSTSTYPIGLVQLRYNVLR